MSMYDHYFSNFGSPPVPDDICKDSAIRHARYLTKILKNIKNQFWLDVFNAHIELQSNNQPKEIHEFQASALFYNKNIKVANTSIYYQACYERGIKL